MFSDRQYFSSLVKIGLPIAIQNFIAASLNAFGVLLDSSSGGYKFLAGTAADGLGNYTLDAKPGTNHLVAMKPGYVAALGASAASARVLAPGTHSTLNLQLTTATRTVIGRITNDSTPPVGLTKPQMPALAL